MINKVVSPFPLSPDVFRSSLKVMQGDPRAASWAGLVKDHRWRFAPSPVSAGKACLILFVLPIWRTEGRRPERLYRRRPAGVPLPKHLHGGIVRP